MNNHFSYTAEMRWFFEGSMPKAIRDWFESENKHQYQERTDRYIVYPSIDTCGLKLRGDELLEVKAKQDVVTGHSMKFRSMSGSISFWEKYTLGPVQMSDLFSGSEVVEVNKERYTIIYSKKEGPINAFDQKNEISTGCQFECTEVLINNEKYWTLGFESFTEKDADIALVLNKIALFVSEKKVFEKLAADGAFNDQIHASYPLFLKRFLK